MLDVHLVEGVPGHMGLARARGYTAGNAEYQTYVDEVESPIDE